jgi:hypothetical protein
MTEDLVEECSLSCLPSSVLIEVHPGQIFGGCELPG